MKKIKLTQGKFALVDDADFEWLDQWKWTFNSNGYAFRLKRPTYIFMHRLLMDFPEYNQVDHINGDRLDNQRHNLRIVSRLQNNRNRNFQRNNTSGVIGVYLDKRYGSWVAYVTRDRKRQYLGSFRTKEAAAVARSRAL
jgi:HNH endonuclease/AP2 domain